MPTDSGVYQLLFRLAEPAEITVGRLGTFLFPAGWYVYTGSAKRHLAHRLARHRRRRKPLRWHIDYLTVVGEVVAVRVEPWAPGRECALHRELAARPRVTEPIPGFGSSDCRCRTHLVLLGETPSAWPEQGAEK